MKSTDNMERGAFETAFQKRFEGAEIQPAEGLWDGIEAAIANDEVARYKRGIAYYRWIAAAGILLIAGLLGYLGYDSRSTPNIAQDTESIEQPLDYSTPDDAPEVSGKVMETTPAEIKEFTTEGRTAATTEANDAGKTSTLNDQLSVKAAQQYLVSSEQPVSTMQQDMAGISGFGDVKPIASASDSLEETIDVPDLPESVAGVPIYPTTRKSEETVLWAGLNMAPGYFDPNYSRQSLQSASPGYQGGTNNLSSQEDHNAGLSMAVGLEMGMHLSGRWQLSSGIQYLNNNVQSTTNLVLNNRTPVLSSNAESFDSDQLNNNAAYAPTDLDNTFQFISIPLQAGYMLVDSRVKLQLNAGVSSDVFLKNKITAVDRSLESVTINSGSDAPFRSVYFNGLIGAQASYEFLPRYMITLEPRYKMALSEFTKSNYAFTSMPSSFGIGVGVKYVFK